MVDVKTAVENARIFLTQFFPEAQYVQLEEVELDEDIKRWYITLSFPDTEVIGIPIYPRPRKYKKFTIDSDTGTVVSMKIRDIK